MYYVISEHQLLITAYFYSKFFVTYEKTQGYLRWHSLPLQPAWDVEKK
jgi:hypothetical protein